MGLYTLCGGDKKPCVACGCAGFCLAGNGDDDFSLLTEGELRRQIETRWHGGWDRLLSREEVVTCTAVYTAHYGEFKHRRPLATVVPTGNSDPDEVKLYFKDSGVLDAEDIHGPLLAFLLAHNEVIVAPVLHISLLLKLPDDTQLMGYWWREQYAKQRHYTPYFQFTVGQARDYMKARTIMQGVQG